ncbi:MAG TPA: VIT family protein, partial [Polyangiaceae bacterium]
MSARRKPHLEGHKSGRAGWLRAAVLGSNDAIVSTASLMVGVAASNAPRQAILVAGVSGLVAGAMSMAAGEYVSVSSQRDAELADIAREKQELVDSPEMELKELAGIYAKRGLDKQLAMQVAKQLSAKDAVEAHVRDELGLDPDALATPGRAAWISATSFATFALIPILFLLLAPETHRIAVVVSSSLASLMALGAFGAYLGGAPLGRATLRVTIGGA